MTPKALSLGVMVNRLAGRQKVRTAYLAGTGVRASFRRRGIAGGDQVARARGRVPRYEHNAHAHYVDARILGQTR